MSNNEQNATPIDDQLIAITAIARAAGYDDGAAWIEKRATAFVERELAEIEPSVVASDPSASKPYQWELCVQCGRARGASGTTPVCAQSIDAADTTHKWTTDVPNRFADPEPSRTEAVKAAIGMVERLVELQYPFYPLPTVDGTKLMPLVAALADAERKLADKTSANAIMSGAINDLHEILAAAEKRTKDAEDGWRAATTHPRGAFCAVFSWPHGQRCSDKAEERYAALARKLATVNDWIGEIARVKCESHHRTECCDNPDRLVPCVHSVAQKYMQLISDAAAIDAPAGGRHWKFLNAAARYSRETNLSAIENLRSVRKELEERT